MRRTIEFVPSARRAFKKLPDEVRKALSPHINALAEDPAPTGVETITGVDHCYRIREGDYRIVYQVRNRELIILVLAVGNRREVYRHLVSTTKDLISRWERENK